jgi:hypothetical protein
MASPVYCYALIKREKESQPIAPEPVLPVRRAFVQSAAVAGQLFKTIWTIARTWPQVTSRNATRQSAELFVLGA